MATKDSFLSSKKTFALSKSSNSDSQYSNLNLNQNNLCSKIAPIHSKTNDTINSKKDTASNKVTDNFNNKESQNGFANETKNGSNRLNGILSNLYNPKVNNSKSIQNYSTTTKSSSNSNSSTLSLHISAYENANPAASNFNKNNDSKGSKKTSWKNIKQTFADSKTATKDSFEIPRQQTNGTKDPEIMQFKASQKLLNPTQQSPVTVENHNTSASKGAKAKKNEEFVTVNARVRPLSNSNEESCLDCDSANRMITVKEEQFYFDKVFDEKADQESIFKDVAVPIIDGFIDGINGSIFAYGQTGSGKTFSMIGPDIEKLGSENHGIIPRAIERIFELLKAEREEKPDSFEFTLKCSFLQIYNEKLYDLLQNNKNGLTIQSSSAKITVNGAAEIEVNNFEKCMNQIQIGLSQRKTAETKMNQESSRSHAVLMLSLVTKSNKIVQRSARLNLVDLAGSERQSQTENTGKQLLEAGSINNSLSTLARVIGQISENAKYVSYRDSELTHLLLDSLGGNSKTTVLFNVHSNSQNIGQIISTLNFAENVKKVKNAAKINESIDCTEIEAVKAENENLRQEICNLKTEASKFCHEKEVLTSNISNQEKTIETLKAELKETTSQVAHYQERSFESNEISVNELVALREEIKELKSSAKNNESLNAENEKLRGQIEKIKSEVSKACREKDDEISQYAKANGTLKTELEEAKAQAENLKKTVEKELGSKTNENKILLKENDELKNKFAVQADKIQELQDKIAELEEENDRLKCGNPNSNEQSNQDNDFDGGDYESYESSEEDDDFSPDDNVSEEEEPLIENGDIAEESGIINLKTKGGHPCEILSKDIGQKMLRIFVSNERKNYYAYKLSKKQYFCFTCKKFPVKISDDGYVEGEWAHGCSAHSVVNFEIVHPNPNNEIRKHPLLITFIQAENNQLKCYVLSLMAGRKSYRCQRCSNHESAQSVYARIWKDKNGKEYVQITGSHICVPLEVRNNEDGNYVEYGIHNEKILLS